MRKEIIIAIIFGLLLAFVITVVINRASQVFRPQNDNQDARELLTELDEDTTPASELAFVIHSPEEGLVQIEDSIIVTGSTDPRLPVILMVNDQEYVSSSDDGGNFSFSAQLKQGGNVLIVYVLRDDGTSLSEQRTVIVGDFSNT